MMGLYAQQSDALGWVLNMTKSLANRPVTVQILRVSKREASLATSWVGWKGTEWTWGINAHVIA
jgi:hypothetical protein